MKRAIAFLVVLFPLLAVAQITFQPGYFIENGVKTECLIKNLAWKNNPASIEYKLTESDAVQIKTIKEISEFSVDKSYKYIRFTVSIDRSETLLSRLGDKKDPIWKQETLFLKIMVEGKINLYQYTENNFVKYFFSTDDTTHAEQLVYKEYLAGTYILENNAFRQQLYNLMKNVTPDMAKFENIKYKENSLVKLFTQYNGTFNQETVNHSQKHNKAYINLKFTPGITFTSMDMENALRAVDFGNKTGYRIGAELEYVLPFNNNKWSIFLDPNYQQYENSKKITETETTFDISYKCIQIPLGIRHYMYLNQKSKFFIDASYIFSFSLGDSQASYEQTSINSSATLTLKPFVSYLAIGGGFSYERYSIAVRFSKTKQLTDNYMSWGSQFSSTNIIVGYKFL